MTPFERAGRVLSSAFFFVAMTAASVGLVDLISPREERQEISERIGSLTAALTESVELISEIEQEIALRQERVSDLERRAETAQALVGLSESQLESVEYILASQLRESDTRAFWQNFALTTGIGFIFYVAGLTTPLIWRRWFSGQPKGKEAAQ